MINQHAYGYIEPDNDITKIAAAAVASIVFVGFFAAIALAVL